MSKLLELFYDGWGELAVLALIFAGLIVLGVRRARRMRLAGQRPATTAERGSDIRRGIGLSTNMFGVSILSVYIGTAVIAVVAFAILIALVLVPKDQYWLVAVCSAPFVVGALYAVYRCDRWFFRRFREFKS